MSSSLTRLLAAAACVTLTAGMAAPAFAKTPQPTGGGGKGKTAKSSCAWSLGYDQPRFGQAYVSVKFQTDKSGNIFPTKWTIRDDSVGVTSDKINFGGTLARTGGNTELFSGQMGARETKVGSPVAIRVLPGERITYTLQVADGDSFPDIKIPTCTGTIKVPKVTK